MSNLTYLLALFACIFGINTLRQGALNLLHGAGLPWKPVHDVFSATAYLLIWLAILRRGAWREPSKLGETIATQMRAGNATIVRAYSGRTNRGTSGTTPSNAIDK